MLFAVKEEWYFNNLVIYMMCQFHVETSLKNFPNQVLVRVEQNIL